MMKKKIMITGLPVVVTLLCVAYLIFQNPGKKSHAPQLQSKPVKVRVKEVTKPRVLLKGAQVTYWKKMTRTQLLDALRVVPTPHKPDLSSVPAEIKTLYAEGYVYIENLRLKSGKELNIVYPKPLIGIQDNEDRTVIYKEEIRIYSSSWKLIHTITTQYPIFYDLTFNARSENLYITSVKTNYDPVIEIYSLHPVRRTHSFLVPKSFGVIKDKAAKGQTIGVDDLEIVSTANNVIIFYDTYFSFLFVARELTENSSTQIWRGKMPILNSSFHQMINPSKTKIVFSYESENDYQNGLLMMDVKTHEVKSITTDSAKIYQHWIVKWVSDHKLVFASQADGQDDWDLYFMTF